MSDLELEKATLEENGEDTQDTENGGVSSKHSSKTSSPVDDLTTDPNFECDVTDVEYPTARITRSKRSKSVGDSPIPSPEPITRTYNLFLTDPDDETEQSTSTSVAIQTQLPHLKPCSYRVTSKTTKIDPEIKAAFKDMTDSFKQIGLSARQNSTNFLGDIPYYGASKDSDKSKNIIPLNEPTRFLDIIEVMTDKAALTESGKINVLKSKLLGPALEYWNTYAGGEVWANARAHLLKLFPEVQSYTSIMAKIPNLKREPKEQISQYATRTVQIYDTLKRLHPANAYPDEVKQSDSIRKLLEVLPVQDRKWIKIDNPVTNTFWDVLKQILTYVETETSLKLTIEDIDKEQKAKSGTYEVNNTQNASGNNQSQKQSSQQASGKGQSANSGNNPSNKQNSNPNAGKQCNYCHNKGHVIAECRKKIVGRIKQ